VWDSCSEKRIGPEGERPASLQALILLADHSVESGNSSLFVRVDDFLGRLGLRGVDDGRVN
jgi:hypothetical protein